jgi:hypothetical protein
MGTPGQLLCCCNCSGGFSQLSRHDAAAHRTRPEQISAAAKQISSVKYGLKVEALEFRLPPSHNLYRLLSSSEWCLFVPVENLLPPDVIVDVFWSMVVPWCRMPV